MSITRVQSLGNRAASSSTNTVTLAAGVQQGNLLVAMLSTGNLSTTFTPPTGWTIAVGNAGSVAPNVSIYYITVTAPLAGTTAFTFTLSAAANSTLVVTEWNSSTGWLSSPVDKTAKNSSASSTTIASGTTLTTTQASELWVAGFGYGSTVQTESGLTAGWTLGTEASGGPNTREAYRVVSATGVASASLAITTATANAGAVATFMPAPPPALSTSPATLSFSATFGGSNPASQNDTLSETAGVATAWTSAITYGSGSGWLSISPASGSLAASGNQTVVVSCALGSLTAGTYTGTITYTATTGGATATVGVTFVVNSSPPPASPSASPTSMSFSGTVGGTSPAGQTDTLTNAGGVSSSWTTTVSYTSGSGWLSVSPVSGTLGAGANTTVIFTCTTGSLSAGTYNATVTYAMGSNQATVAVSFTLTPVRITQYTIKLAGQDITSYVDQMTVDVEDTLGQGAGAGSSGSTQGRASTVKFNCTLGPMSTAIGAGQTIPTGGPWLVRQGEVVIYDATGTIIFGGFATKFTDTTTSVLGQTKQNFTTVEGIDYSTSLQRTLVNEVFTGATDIFIINYIMNKYVGWVNLQYMPTSPAYTFATKNFRNVTVEQVIQTVAGITGYLVFVDYLKNLHYVSPTTASSAPFNLSSVPDFITTFPHAVEEYLIDDTSAINRVFFYGGTKTSVDFWQDISTLANGNNVTFPLAYYPSPMTDGKYHLKINGVDQTVTTSTAAGAAGQFISQGGTATVLIDPGAKTITFDTGYAPAAGTTLLAGYRYAFPLSLVITDENSHQYYGPTYLDGSIDDNTIFDLTTAIQRCKVLLAQQSLGLVTLKLVVYNKPGIQAGMIVHVYNQLRGINGTYLVQGVQISPMGAGNFSYHLTLGAWNWNLIDFLMKLPTLATFSDNQDTTQETVSIVQVLSNVQVHDAWSTKTSQQGVYYARSAAVGDGHDAYPGFSTVTS